MNWTDSLSVGKPTTVDQKAAMLRQQGYSEVDEWEIGKWAGPVSFLGANGRRILWCDAHKEFYRHCEDK